MVENDEHPTDQLVPHDRHKQLLVTMEQDLFLGSSNERLPGNLKGRSRVAGAPIGYTVEELRELIRLLSFDGW
ncbi:hypothetical protein C9413_30005 [Rhizobium sp. SEMIA 4085]|uniref:Uncharacterized protein n=1 Tax=Rhizobium gallicum bv. gallicum R602sp TaxID=1041138 RepID=A0A0B4XH40_9HYPH|nr:MULTISPECIES: hypothetical protein [Rhizobium]AJD45762.1 hypothetical protein RGR602_PC01738 [Rhizobium gallicum bv. gallicum R602sp]NNH33480.1 hypothetical protein [Rhizobium sp. SEMIA 4085]